MKLILSTALVLTTILSLQSNSIKAQTPKRSESSKINLFSSDLLPLIVGNKSTQNVVYSPVAIYASLALAYLGAKDRTANEIRSVLKLDQEDIRNFASEYGNFLKTTFKKSKPEKNTPQLSITNRLYVSNKIKILEKFNEIAQENFDAKAENVDFSEALTAVEKINKWVAEQTENKIKNLMQPNAVNPDTNAILVNAIYFKANWSLPFEVYETRKTDFYISSSEKVQVDTMYSYSHYNYVALPDLDATAIEMPYKKSDISMLIILPNKIEGLKELETRLKHIDLNDIISQMILRKVNVYLPKFRIEFDIDLKESLESMGCSAIFKENADLSGIFDSSLPQRISNVKHKAFLDCNEYGSEGAAAFYVNFMPVSNDPGIKTFRADHPFFFAIRSQTAVFFVGHVARF